MTTTMRQILTQLKQTQLPIILLAVSLITLCAALQLSNGVEWANLHMEKTKGGEYWRLLTGHLIHLDWQHYLMNMIGLSLCLAVYSRDLAVKHWPLSILFISLFSSFGMIILEIPYVSYMGFSDVLHGWILLGASALMHREPKLALAVYILFWLKIIEENMELPFFTNMAMDINVAKESHILGAVGGMVYSLLFFPSFRTWLGKPSLKKQESPRNNNQ